LDTTIRKQTYTINKTTNNRGKDICGNRNRHHNMESRSRYINSAEMRERCGNRCNEPLSLVRYETIAFCNGYKCAYSFSKYMKDVLKVQGVWHSISTLLAMVRSDLFCIMTRQQSWRGYHYPPPFVGTLNSSMD
jgi:hypothetical protein